MNGKLKRIAYRFVLYGGLFCGVIVVLLPLFWMMLTALKQRGQALEFRFLPAAMVEGPKKTLLPLKKGEVMVTFEYDPARYPGLPAPGEVSVAGEFNGWDKSRDTLVKDSAVWVTTLKGLKPGKYQYKFVVNGSKWTADQTNPQKTGDGNSLMELKVGRNSNKALADATHMAGDKVFFQIRRPGATSLKVKLKGQDQLLELTSQDGVFVGETSRTLGERVEYQILEGQSFVAGASKIYTTQNFIKVLNNDDFPFGWFFLNSLIVAAGTAFITVVICTMAGYAFAKKQFFLKDQLFFILMSTMMIPGMIFMVPQFAIVNKLGWINSYQGMMVPHLANIFGLFLLRQYIYTIPNSLFEAATIDGASEWQIFKIIIIPLSFPIMVTLFLMTFVSQWGNFLWQLIVNTPDSPYRTLPVGLALFKGQYGQDWEMMMAGACFSIVPIAILFLMAQRFFIEGMTSGAVKE